MRLYLSLVSLLHIFNTEGLTMPPGVALPSQFCVDKQLETKYPDPTDCGYYYFCGVVNKVRQRCAPGTFFHDTSKTCEFPENVPSCIEQLYGDANSENSHNLEGLVEYQVTVVGNQLSGQATRTPVSVDVETPGAAFRSQTRQASSNMIENPRKISNLEQEIKHKDIIGSSVGSRNDVLSNSNQYVKGTQTIKQNLQKRNMGKQSLEMKEAQLINMNHHHESQVTFCVGKTPGNYPDSEDCLHFYQCSVSLSRRQECAPGTVFNPRLKFCDHPQNVPSCRTSALKSTQKPSEKSTQQNVQMHTQTTSEKAHLDSKLKEVQKDKLIPSMNKNKLPTKIRRIVINYEQSMKKKTKLPKDDKTNGNVGVEQGMNRRFDLKPSVQKTAKSTKQESTSHQYQNGRLQGNQINSGKTRKQQVTSGNLSDKLFRRSQKTKQVESQQEKNGFQVLTRRNGGLLHPEIRQFLVPIADSKGRLAWFYPIPMQDKTGKIVVRYLHVPKPFENSALFRSPRRNGNVMGGRTTHSA